MVPWSLPRKIGAVHQPELCQVRLQRFEVQCGLAVDRDISVIFCRVRDIRRDAPIADFPTETRTSAKF